MNESVLVSVIIPVYNVQEFLPEALESVVCQTYDKLEIIIIDDGSTDKSGNICDEYAKKDTRIKVLHQDNKGLSAARNTGLDISTGEVIAFLDSDDAYHITFIETMLNAMNSSRAELVICKHSIVTTEDRLDNSSIEKIVPEAQQGLYDRISALRALADGHINHGVWNKLYNRKLWNNIRFPLDHVYEEIDTTYRIIDLCDRVCIIDDLLYMYRRRPGSITNSYTTKSAKDFFLAQNHFETFMKENIPDVFSQEQLIKMQKSILNQMIIYYCRLSSLNGVEEKRYCDELREKIQKMRFDVNNIDCDFRIKLCYWMIYFCPKTIKLVCTVYFSIRQLHGDRLLFA